MPRRLKIVNYVTFMLAVTRVWSVGEGLGFMWSTGIGHHKNTHRNRRSDWLVVKRRDCHYQVILEKKITFLCQVYAKKQVWYSSLQWKTQGDHHHPHLHIPDGKDPCQSLLRLARNYHLRIQKDLRGFICRKPLTHMTSSYNATDKRNCYNTCNVLLKNNFGSFKEVLSDYKNFLASFHWAAVETLSQDLWHSCWLSWRVKEDSNYH